MVYEGRCWRNVLVMDIFSLAVDLVDQREVEVETFDPFSVEHPDLGLVLLILHVFDHIGEPHSQPVVADTHRNIQTWAHTKTKWSALLDTITVGGGESMGFVLALPWRSRTNPLSKISSKCMQWYKWIVRNLNDGLQAKQHCCYLKAKQNHTITRKRPCSLSSAADSDMMFAITWKTDS